MRLQNLVVELISLTNLTYFLDRVFDEGQYKAAIFLYDNISTRDNNFISEIATVSFGKCSIVTVDIIPPNEGGSLSPFFNHFDYIEIVMMDSRDWDALIRSLSLKYIYDCTLDMVFVLQMYPGQNLTMMVKQFESELYSQLALVNCVLVFYRVPGKGDSSSLEKSLEVFTLYSSSAETSQNISTFDVANHSADVTMTKSDDASLKNTIMGSKNKRIVILTIPSSYRRLEDSEFTMVDDANIYLSNFLSNNIKSVAVASRGVR